MRDVCIIPLGRRGTYECRVSAHRYAALTKWRWNWKISAWKYGANVYARRGGGRGRGGSINPTIYMADFILRELMGVPRPSPRHTVHHRNGNTLDNADDNLRWATKSEQSAQQKPRMAHATRKAIDDARMAA